MSAQRERDDDFLEDHLGGRRIGQEVTLRAKISGLVDFGAEIQLQLPNGLFLYIPFDTAKAVLEDVK